jgi:hypothetical protein
MGLVKAKEPVDPSNGASKAKIPSSAVISGGRVESDAYDRLVQAVPADRTPELRITQGYLQGGEESCVLQGGEPPKRRVRIPAPPSLVNGRRRRIQPNGAPAISVCHLRFPAVSGLGDSTGTVREL